MRTTFLSSSSEDSLSVSLKRSSVEFVLCLKIELPVFDKETEMVASLYVGSIERLN